MTMGRQGVVGDGMVGRFNNVKQGDLGDFQARRGGSLRSQSVHMARPIKNVPLAS